MSSSKEVFALRKAGSLDEAYAMALEVIEAEPNEEWNIKALAWCLYDLTKRSVSQNDSATAKIYVQKLEALVTTRAPAAAGANTSSVAVDLKN